jgi:hypothetical protein
MHLDLEQTEIHRRDFKMLSELNLIPAFFSVKEDDFMQYIAC